MIDVLKHLVKQIVRPEYRIYASQIAELQKIKRNPRYTELSTHIFGQPIKVADSASFVYMYQEIFQKEIYKFIGSSDKPYIIDCGANIGLSIIYFKKCFPDAEIIGFEPDEKVFEILRYNVDSLGISNIKLIKKALWHEETILTFFTEGADSGNLYSGSTKVKVQTERLRKYINKTVDFLKVDIEGAETEVLRDCEDLLFHVKNLFIEYHSFVDKPQTLNFIIHSLTQAGFRIHIQPGGLVSNQPFFNRNIDYNMDLQLNIFAFRD